MNMDNKMTVVFIGFDGYSDMWHDCISLYKIPQIVSIKLYL